MTDAIIGNCINCYYLDDVSGNSEHGHPWNVCTKKPNMSNLKGFPFKTEQKCFQIHWSHSEEFKRYAGQQMVGVKHD